MQLFLYTYSTFYQLLLIEYNQKQLETEKSDETLSLEPTWPWLNLNLDPRSPTQPQILSYFLDFSLNPITILSINDLNYKT